jgi:hypothetical protein
MPIIPIKVELGAFAEGEVPPDLLITFRDIKKVVVDLTGFSNLQMNIEEELGDDGFGTGTIALTDATNGLVTYTWVREDMTTVGEYTAQAWVNNGTKYFASDLYIYSVYDGPGTQPT